MPVESWYTTETPRESSRCAPVTTEVMEHGVARAVQGGGDVFEPLLASSAASLAVSREAPASRLYMRTPRPMSTVAPISNKRTGATRANSTMVCPREEIPLPTAWGGPAAPQAPPG